MKVRGSAVTPIVLVVLAAGGAAYAYFVDQATVSDADRAARRLDVFPSFRVDAVRRVELAHGGEAMVLTRDTDGGAGWALVSTATPRPDPADAAVVDVLLRELEMATRVRDVREGDAAGLDAPRVRGHVTLGALDYRFDLGADAPQPAGAAYMRLEGEGTFVVGRSLAVQLLRGADAYRDRTVAAYGASEVATLEERAGVAGGFVLERHGAVFRVGTAAGLRASRSAVEQVFGALADVRAECFIDDATADRATTSPALALTLTPRTAGRGTIRLFFGGPCPEDGGAPSEDVVVVRTAPSRLSACVARGAIDALAAGAGAGADAIVDTSPLYAHADEVEELRLEPAGDGAHAPHIDLARRGEGWHERAPEDRDLSADDVESANALVAALVGARAVDVRRAAADERFALSSRVIVIRSGGVASEALDLGEAGADGRTPVRRAEDGALLHLTRDAARRFEPHPAALRNPPLWSTAVDPGAVVAIDDTCTPEAQHVELHDGLWVGHAAASFPVDALATADLATAVAHAKAQAWIAEGDDGGFGFGVGAGVGKAPACAVTLTLAPETDGGVARHVALTFGADSEGGTFARADDSGHAGAVFLASATLRTVASRPVVDRAQLRLDPARVSRVVLVRGEARLVVARDRSSERLSRRDRSGAADAGDATDAGDEVGAAEDPLVTAFGRLSASYAVHTGAATRDEGFDRPTLEVTASTMADAGVPPETRIAIGAPVHAGAMDGYYARVSGVDATFFVAKSVVLAILDAW